MPGAPYLDKYGRPRINVLWKVGASRPAVLSFLIDSGATRSAISPDNCVGLRVVGAAEVSSPAGGVVKRFIFGDGAMEFEVIDSASGGTVTERHEGPVLALDDEIMGIDVLAAFSLGLRRTPQGGFELVR